MCLSINSLLSSSHPMSIIILTVSTINIKICSN